MTLILLPLCFLLRLNCFNIERLLLFYHCSLLQYFLLECCFKRTIAPSNACSPLFYHSNSRYSSVPSSYLLLLYPFQSRCHSLRSFPLSFHSISICLLPLNLGRSVASLPLFHFIQSGVPVASLPITPSFYLLHRLHLICSNLEKFAGISGFAQFKLKI